MNTDIARHFGHLVVRAARNVPCVALDDEVHMVLKSLQLLRQCQGRAKVTLSHHIPRSAGFDVTSQ